MIACLPAWAMASICRADNSSAQFPSKAQKYEALVRLYAGRCAGTCKREHYVEERRGHPEPDER
jgi:hypothetical protein